jgi:hypothetical protein
MVQAQAQQHNWHGVVVIIAELVLARVHSRARECPVALVA